MHITRIPEFTTPESRWTALTERDHRADGAFLYAVKTTGVYCRPGCSSRLPRRENVEFFDDGEAAERAGYRPCKRCLPGSTSPLARKTAMIKRACKRIEVAEEPLTLKDLAAQAGLSPYHFHRLFKTTLGVTPKEYAAARRIGRFRDGLKRRGSVTEAIYEAGFGSSSRAYESAACRLGMMPSAYKNGAAGLVIRFAVASCFLGRVLIAATERGICAIEFGDSPDTLQARLQNRFPKARLDPAEPDFAAWIEQVIAFIESPGRGLSLPLDIQGTAFQQRVWKALQAVPAGTTASYAQIAERIGSPNAIRAVAQACASNKLAVAIPCHRVVRSDGDLSGYRWGVERKRALLKRENARQCPQPRSTKRTPTPND